MCIVRTPDEKATLLARMIQGYQTYTELHYEYKLSKLLEHTLSLGIC
jgi:hypothetical protein